MQLVDQALADARRVARDERTGGGSVVRPAMPMMRSKAAVASGQSARVIMQFATIAERDAAFNRLLDRGAAVRAVDTEAGPALVVFGSAAVVQQRDRARPSQVSLDAGVRVSAATHSPRATPRRPQHGHRPRCRRRSARRARHRGRDRRLAASRRTPICRSAASAPTRTSSAAAASRSTTAATARTSPASSPGSGARSNGLYAGIAPDVDIVALRVLGDDCSGNTSDVIDALEWIARNHETYQIKVVNISLGHAVLESIFTDPLVQAVERLSRKGIAIVTAAGNKGINPATELPGYGGVGVPCNAPSAICVGSLDTHGHAGRSTDDRVSDSSSRGPTRFDLLAKPDLVAPGVEHRVAGGARQPPVQRVRAPARAGRDRPAGLLHAVGHEHGVAGGGRRRGAAAAGEPRALGSRPEDLAAVHRAAGAADRRAHAGRRRAEHSRRADARRRDQSERASRHELDSPSPHRRESRRRRQHDQLEPPHHLRRSLRAAALRASCTCSGGTTTSSGPYASRQHRLGQPGDNIVWGNDDIVWGNGDNIVWGNDDTSSGRAEHRLGQRRASASRGAPSRATARPPTTTSSGATACASGRQPCGSGRQRRVGLLGWPHRGGQDAKTNVWRIPVPGGTPAP